MDETTRFSTNDEFRRFASYSGYNRIVDLKKLRFIYRSLLEFSGKSGTPLSQMDILEVGCGKGDITLPLASIGGRVRAFDIDRQAIESLSKKIEEMKADNIKVTVDDAFKFNDAARYDVLVASEVLEHLLESELFLDRMASLLHPGSFLILTIPNGYGPWEIKNRLNPLSALRKGNIVRKVFGKRPYRMGMGGDHCRFFTRSQVMCLFEERGFRLLRLENSDSFLSLFFRFTEGGRLGTFDLSLADRLPSSMACGWYFLFEKD